MQKSGKILKFTQNNPSYHFGDFIPRDIKIRENHKVEAKIQEAFSQRKFLYAKPTQYTVKLIFSEQLKVYFKYFNEEKQLETEIYLL